MTDLLLFKDIDEPGLDTLDVYSRRGGYEALRKALSMTPAEVLHELEVSAIRGRGGKSQEEPQSAGRRDSTGQI